MHDGMRFARLDDDQLRYVEHAGIGPAFVTRAQATATRAVLGLDGMGADDLLAVRNAVVRHLADLKRAARDGRDMEAFDRLDRNMSGIAAVIDSLIHR